MLAMALRILYRSDHMVTAHRCCQVLFPEATLLQVGKRRFQREIAINKLKAVATHVELSES